MVLLSLAQITQQLRSTLSKASVFSSTVKQKDVLSKKRPEVVVYPRRVKTKDKIIITLTNIDAPATSGLSMPVTPHYVAPRAPIVLCHGLYGFDKIGPDSLPLLQVQYWGGIENELAKLGAKVIVTKVPSTGSILDRAHTLHSILKSILEGKDVNFVAHSMVFMSNT
jgi:hypothetical protein